MNNPLLKIAGLAALILSLHTPARAQDEAKIVPDDDTTGPAKGRSIDEITIRHKGDKDAKVTVEIKNGEVLINGKPASEYKDDDLTITRHKLRSLGNGGYAFSDGDGLAMTPFRNYNGGVWNYEGRPRKTITTGAFLGVTSSRDENGPEGAKVGEVSEGSAAEKAGLKEGDLITNIDGKSIDGPETLAKVVRSYKPGDKVTITFRRAGKEQKATAELGKSKNSVRMYGFNGDGNWNLDGNSEDILRNFKFNEPRAYVMPKGFGFSYGDNPLRLGIHAQDTEDGKGVKVLDVDDETAADKAGIKEGDIITRFDGQEVNSATKLAELARASRDDRSKSSIKVNLLRNGKPMEVEVKVPRKLKTADL